MALFAEVSRIRLASLVLVVLLVLSSQSLAFAQDDEAPFGVSLTANTEVIPDFLGSIPNFWLPPEGTSPRYEIQVLRTTTELYSCAYTSGSINAFQADYEIAIIDLETNAELGQQFFEGTSPNAPSCASVVSSDDLGTYTGAPDTSLMIGWIFNTLSQNTDLPSISVLLGHTGLIHSVAYSPDGSRIVTASRDGTVRLWDASTQTELFQFAEHEGDVNDAQFSSDGALIATAGDDGIVFVLDAETGEVMHEIQTESERFIFSHFSPSDAFLVLGGRGAGIGGSLWSLESNEQVWELPIGAEAASWRPDESQLVVLTGALMFGFDVTTGEELYRLGQQDTVVDYSPNGLRVMTVGGRVKLYDSETQELLLEFMRDGLALFDAKFGPDGETIVTAAGQSLQVWDANTGENILTIPNLTFRTIDISPDGQYMVGSTLRSDTTVLILDLSTLLE